MGDKLKINLEINTNKMFKHLNLLKEYIKINLATAMEYRFNFIVQSLSMVVNDFIWIAFWWIFFEKFQSVNGWQMFDMLSLYAVMTFSWGVAAFIFGNKSRLALLIAEGRLDFFLTLPKNELWHVIIGRSSWFAVGDIIFGLIMAVVSLELIQFPMFFIVSFLSMTIFVSFGIIVGSLGFFWGNAQETARTLNIGLVSFSSYPLSVFHDTARLILLTVIPAGFVTTIPVQLIRNFDLKWFLLLLLVALVFITIAIIVFRTGLKKYESGNLIAARV